MHGPDSQAGIYVVTQTVIEDCILTIKKLCLLTLKTGHTVKIYKIQSNIALL